MAAARTRNIAPVTWRTGQGGGLLKSEPGSGPIQRHRVTGERVGDGGRLGNDRQRTEAFGGASAIAYHNGIRSRIICLDVVQREAAAGFARDVRGVGAPLIGECSSAF